MDGATTTIDLGDDVERWEWRCPRGHIRWQPTADHWWCPRCAREADDGVFYELTSARTGETLRREAALLRTEGRSADG